MDTLSKEIMSCYLKQLQEMQLEVLNSKEEKVLEVRVHRWEDGDISILVASGDAIFPENNGEMYKTSNLYSFFSEEENEKIIGLVRNYIYG